MSQYRRSCSRLTGALMYSCVYPGGLGAVRRRLRRVVPPGVRWRYVRNGRKRGLRLHGLHRQGRRGGLRGHGGGGGGGERRSAVHIPVQCATPAISGGLVVAHTHSTTSSSLTSARASAGQLAFTEHTKTEIEYCTSHNVRHLRVYGRL